MKYLLALFLGLGTVGAAACKSDDARTSDVKGETVVLSVSGMT